MHSCSLKAWGRLAGVHAGGLHVHAMCQRANIQYCLSSSNTFQYADFGCLRLHFATWLLFHHRS